MASNYPRGGLWPRQGHKATTKVLNVSASTSALFLGTPITVTAGVVCIATTSAVTGTILGLWNAAGKAVCNLPATAGAGCKAEITFGEHTEYVISCYGTGMTEAKVGTYFFALTSETGTASADPLKGARASSVQCATAGLVNSRSSTPFVAGALLPGPNNTYATDGCKIACTIHPSDYKAA